MIIDTPVVTATKPSPAVSAKGSDPREGSWRYESRRRARGPFITAMLVSAAFHAGIFFGIRHQETKHKAPVKDDTPVIALTIPDLKDLEEPEPITPDEAPPIDLGLSPPMQADVPQIARADDFVQQIDISSLVQKPDFSKAALYTIPQHRGRGLGEGFGQIFNLADLDRIPVATVQPAPIYPVTLKREALQATVKVEFIVDTEGRVVNAMAIDSTHPGFNEAAVEGVSKWKFRAGMRAGRKVNTKMMVPINFRVTDS